MLNIDGRPRMFPEAYVRTLIANLTGGNAPKTSEWVLWDHSEIIPVRKHYLGWLVYMAGCLQPEYDRPLPLLDWATTKGQSFGVHFSRIWKDRVFFTTRGGKLGVGPKELRVVDEVAVFFYCPIPYVLRSKQAKTGTERDGSIDGEQESLLARHMCMVLCMSKRLIC